jgi:hypothetical protein
MDSELARKFLQRYPETIPVVKQILEYHDIDYDNIESFRWEIRMVKLPDVESQLGEKVFQKLYIDGAFVINIIPLTPELLVMIDERFPKKAIDETPVADAEIDIIKDQLNPII